MKRLLFLSLFILVSCSSRPTQKVAVTDTPGIPLTPETTILTQTQQDAIDQKAQDLLAANEAEAVQISHKLHFEGGEEDPSNMCGPLALFILREAGIVSPNVNLHWFWLLNPRLDRAAINKVFPPDEFSDRRFTQPINQFDFTKFPLQAGDFLYLYAGRNGTFEHMLTVTRVDDQGRAYSITNYDIAPKSFVIQEVMLYDPTQPGTGKFYDWTNHKNEKLGLTGFGGFELWRRKVSNTE